MMLPVQERLGHSRPDIVLIQYAKLLAESAIAAAAAVSPKVQRFPRKKEKCWCVTNWQPNGSQFFRLSP